MNMTVWRLSTLAAGTGLMVYGATLDLAPDWTVRLALFMCLSTFLTTAGASWIVIGRHWWLSPLIPLLAWISVDLPYTGWLPLGDPMTLKAMRSANWPASLTLWLLCLIIWWPRVVTIFIPTR